MSSSLFCVFIYDLFNDAASSLDYIVSDGRIISENCVWRSVEGTVLFQFGLETPNLFGGTEAGHKLQPWYPSSEQILNPGPSHFDGVMRFAQ
jgi:hypothetical protein